MSGGGWRMMSSAGSGVQQQDRTMINPLMLRFRPIAPKPTTGGAQDPGVSPMNKKGLLSSKHRSKRKYVRVCNKNKQIISKRNKKHVTPSSDDHHHHPTDGGREDKFNKLATLQLLPERSNPKETPDTILANAYVQPLEAVQNSWCNHDLGQASSVCSKLKQPPRAEGLERVAETPAAVESWVTVECVTDTSSCMGGYGRAELLMKKLEDDTCPWFVSDGLNNVWWVNETYKKMVMVEKENDGVLPKVIVWLVVKEKLLPYLYNCESFTCWVRLQYCMWKNSKKKGKWSQMVPCDVWRMNCGGFAWKLDIEAALSLGR